MSTINQVRRKSPRADGAHLNWMGGRSWDITNPLTRLRVAASSCFFGEPMYYHDAKDAPRKPGPRRASALSALSTFISLEQVVAKMAAHIAKNSP